jgi:hypothetical protein
MESIEEARSLRQLKLTIESFSTGRYTLDKAYNEAMERVKAQNKVLGDQAMRILSWITHASRHLTITELQHALAVEVGEKSFDEDNISDIEEVINACAGLVAINTEQNTVELVHCT